MGAAPPYVRLASLRPADFEFVFRAGAAIAWGPVGTDLSLGEHYLRAACARAPGLPAPHAVLVTCLARAVAPPGAILAAFDDAAAASPPPPPSSGGGWDATDLIASAAACGRDAVAALGRPSAEWDARYAALVVKYPRLAGRVGAVPPAAEAAAAWARVAALLHTPRPDWVSAKPLALRLTEIGQRGPHIASLAVHAACCCTYAPVSGSGRTDELRRGEALLLRAIESIATSDSNWVPLHCVLARNLVRQGRSCDALEALHAMLFAVGIPRPEALPWGVDKLLVDGLRAGREAVRAVHTGDDDASGAAAYAALRTQFCELFPAHAAELRDLREAPEPMCNMN